MLLSGRTSRSPLLWDAAALLIASAVLMAAVVLGRGPHPAPASSDGLPHTTVEVSAGHCGRGRDHPVPGVQVFELHNTSAGAAEVYLEDPHSRAAYGEVEDIGPGTTRELTVRLGKGSYAFLCVPDDAVTGPTVRLTRGRGGPAAAPVTEDDLIPPAIAYQKWVGGGLGEVVRLTDALKDAIDRGDLAAARAACATGTSPASTASSTACGTASPPAP